MNERSATNKIMAELKTWGGVLLKHSDRFTKGIPDLSYSAHGRTWWFEVKFVYVRGPELRLNAQQFPKLQAITMRQLEQHARALYLVVVRPADTRHDLLWLARPQDILAWHNQGLDRLFVSNFNVLEHGLIRLRSHVEGKDDL